MTCVPRLWLYPNCVVRGFVAFGERAEDDEEESTKNIHAVNLRSVEKVAKSDEKTETEWQAKARKLGEVSRVVW